MKTANTGTGHCAKVGYVVLILGAMIVSGCAELQTKVDWLWDKIQGKQQAEKTEDRGTAAEKYGYAGKKDQLTVEMPVIKPSIVKPGDRVSQQISYVVLSPEKDKEFDVTEVITLVGSNIRLELSRKTTRRTQGSYLSNLEFVIPQDLPAGTYQLLTKIAAAGDEKQQTATFILKK